MSAPRWWAFLADRDIHCAAGHHIPNTFRLTEVGFVRCGHRLSQRTECNRWVFVYIVRGGRAVVADVSLPELRELEQMATPAQMLEYLGVLAARSA